MGDSVKLCSRNNSIEAEQIVILLKDNGIPAYTKNGVMKVYGGNSIENDIYVSSDDYEKSVKLISENCTVTSLGVGNNRNAFPKIMKVILLLIIAFIVLAGIIVPLI